MHCHLWRYKIAHVTNLDESSLTQTEQYVAASNKDRHLFYWIALPILFFDQLSKWWVINNIPLNQQYVPIAALYPYFKFTHVANTGAVFGLLQNGFIWLSILAVLVAGGLVYYNRSLPLASRTLRVALGLVFGGALGNLLDRIRLGHVTDFVDLDFSSLIPLKIADWYIWNIADLAIVCAIVLMVYLTLFDPQQIEGKPPATTATDADIAGIGALEVLEHETLAQPTTPSLNTEFQSAAEVASINPDNANSEALDMLDFSETPRSASELVDLENDTTPK